MRLILSACALMLIILSSGVAQADSGVPATPKPEASSELSFPEAFSQSDPRWRTTRLGKTTIGKSGCLVTALSIVAQAAGYTYTPAQLVMQLNLRGLITRDGLLKTGLVHVVLPTLSVVDRFTVQPANVQKIRAYLMHGSFVLLKVDRSPKPGIQQHWVVATGYTQDDIRIIDPNGGKRGTIASLFGTNASTKEALVLEKG